ncbi:hypothetical protein Y032_0202g1773 [Ancylostoma ceylanicum]|uniref:Uncharacterized protein n=1 Tax=Ancylostoma ceylanicum TaxID=53326 RepID=A0A016SN52_9BILA|nr:hypothetical protein Y032_0202g1773 [Ancylostoma ceylanicum]
MNKSFDTSSDVEMWQAWAKPQKKCISIKWSRHWMIGKYARHALLVTRRLVGDPGGVSVSHQEEDLEQQTTVERDIHLFLTFSDISFVVNLFTCWHYHDKQQRVSISVFYESSQ